MASTLPSLEKFDCDDDPGSVGLRWEKWKRAFKIFLTAANIEHEETKRAILLHTGGLGLQEIFYSIPGAQGSGAEGEKVYELAIKTLDEYFNPKQSKIYERHTFRLMKQEAGEKFDKFIVRLRIQAEKCKFSDMNDQIIDQVTEKCRLPELRKKILLMPDEAINLHTIIAEANALETITRQLDNFSGGDKTQDVHKLETTRQVVKLKCSRCGSTNHLAADKACPARNKKCLKCGYVGHYKECCQTSKRKYSGFKNTLTNETQGTKRSKLNTTRYIQDADDYVFHIDNDDSLITAVVGGVSIDFLIDSGSKCNLLTDKTWESLKNKKIRVCNQIKHPDKIFMPYGKTQPLQVVGSFESDITISGITDQATFYVIQNGTKDLLGKTTAQALGVLRIGLDIYTISSFPKFKDVLVELPIDSLVTPVYQPYRRIPIPLETKVNNKIKELVDSDIIEEVNEPSRWVSSMVPILQDNGEVRICIDMRRANAAIIRENHPLPTMDQLLPKIRGAKLFSKLDVKQAFHQIEIMPSSRHITTFITSKGLYRYKRLMFGISCAPEIYQKVMEKMLITCEGTINFIDDILVFGADEQEHNQRLDYTLQVLRENNVLLNTKKCVYNLKEIEFLGHNLSVSGVRPLGKYIKVIQNFRTPNTVEEIQSFLGLVNFVGKWLPNLATLTEPLRKLLRLKLGKKANIQKFWTTEQTSAFQHLQQALTTIPTLGYYNPADKTQVIADASPVGLGAVLIQINSEGPRIIAYGNKSLSDCEKRYCQTEKEALALVWAIEHFKIYLYGKKDFDLISDHKPLETIFGKKIEAMCQNREMGAEATGIQL